MLEDVQKQLGEAKADKTENTRSQKKAEFIDNLKKLFPGVYGRLADLCEPVHKRYFLLRNKIPTGQVLKFMTVSFSRVVVSGKWVLK